MDAEHSDEDDPVVQEMDVILTNDLMDSTYLLQFPLQSTASGRSKGLGLSRATACRVKSGRKRMEIDLAMDTTCSNYDDDSEHCSTTHTLESSTTPFRTNYAVGVVRGEPAALHITPLHAICQMRPSFKKLDEREEKKKEAEAYKLMQAAKDGEEKSEELTDKLQSISVTIKRAESERMAERRKKSHAHLAGQDSAEPWVTMDLHTVDSEVAKAKLEQLVSAEEAPPLQWDLNTEQYFAALGLARQTEASESVDDVAILATHVGKDADILGGETPALSAHDRATMPLDEQVAALFRIVHVFHFQRIVSLVNYGEKQYAAAEVLQVVQKYANLVQGCWVMQSELMYPDADALWVLAGNFVQLALAQCGEVDSRAVAALSDLDPRQIAELLQNIAVHGDDKAKLSFWKLKLPVDKLFLKSHAGVVKRYREHWGSQKARIVEELRRAKEAQAAAKTPFQAVD